MIKSEKVKLRHKNKIKEIILISRGVLQTQYNYEPAFGSTHKEISNIFRQTGAYTKNQKVIMENKLSDIVKNEIAQGRYLQANSTLEKAIKISEHYSEKGEKQKGKTICSITSKIAEKHLYPAIDKLRKQYDIKRTSISRSGRNLLKKLSYTS